MIYFKKGLHKKAVLILGNLISEGNIHSYEYTEGFKFL